MSSKSSYPRVATKSESVAEAPVGLNHFPPFAAFEHQLAMRLLHEPNLSSVQQLKAVLRAVLEAMPLDQALYLERYPDVAAAVDAGQYASPRQHFLEVGYFEGRHAWPSKVNEDWYVKTYTDVGQGIAAGDIKDATSHFERFGFVEGRLPAPID